MKTVSPESQQSLVQWVSQATGISSIGVKIRLRGNDLHILCEGRDCPQRWHTLSDLLQALQQTDLDALTKSDQPSIYQVFVYGRKKGENRPQWCHRVYLNQLGRHLEQVQAALLVATARESQLPGGGSIILSNESLARKGDPDAIARYLSETLSTLGVSVMVRVKRQKPKDDNELASNRLWVFCNSNYSPDAKLIAEPVAEKLRLLKLTGYQDAVIACQIGGENKPDWLLRIDLTLPETMLKEWGRWGDVQAIAKLCNLQLASENVVVKVSQKESTLHLFCTPSVGKEKIPTKETCIKVIEPLLETLAPQGVLAATIYGQKSTDSQPTWVDWLKLPATQNTVFALSPWNLAASGDEPAIIFLLERLLNPDLEKRLLTGGIRVVPRRKGDLLHIMCDAPVCPQRKRVVRETTEFLRQLKIPGIAGVRIYGRRAGNKEPSWSHGVDFEQRQQRLIPEANPEFAATSAHVNELIPPNDNEPVLRPDLTETDVQGLAAKVTQDWSTSARKLLLGSGLFAERESNESTQDYQGLRVALIWGTLGLLLTLQTDWVLGNFLARKEITSKRNSSISQQEGNKSSFIVQSSGNDRNSVFNASGFTNTQGNQVNSKTAPRQRGTATAILLAARSQTPSFNARQLDEQLALYKERLAQKGRPPDVLIIGSSRALRGIDPQALSKGLTTQGYPDVDVFNFGINGATAQVVDFIIRRVLEPSELPKMILWADGARAFNSGREDATFASIASSPGYMKAMERQIAEPGEDEGNNSASGEKVPGKPEQNVYQAMNDWLNQTLGAISPTYRQREQLKSALTEQVKSLPIMSDFSNKGTSANDPNDNSDEASLQAVDFDGFLPLSIRFEPGNYYKKHSKVTGSYDNDYKSFALAGRQEEATKSLLKFAKKRNISVVFVNMPLTSDYLDPVRSQHELEFQQFMVRMSESSNFIFRDLSLLFPQKNEHFSDPSHLNRYGAYEVSKKLATDPMIAWPRK